MNNIYREPTIFTFKTKTNFPLLGLRHFTEDEAWGDPHAMDYKLLYYLDSLREFIKVPIVIHCGTQGIHCKNSYHYQGKAVDCYAKGISLLAFYLAAERFSFGGIGIYPNWNNPGLHLDVRLVEDDIFPRVEPAARWGKVNDEYIALDEDFVKKFLI